MDKYTASNGATVERYSRSLSVRPKDDELTLGEVWIEPWATDVLGEFFRAVRDEELGRWRWPENPDYVVYPRGDAWLVLSERSGNSKHYPRREHADVGTSVLSQAMRAYFEAHPERKPWDSAQRDEVWLFKSSGNGRALAWRAEDGWDVIDQVGNYHRGIEDVPAEMRAHSFYGWENPTAVRMEGRPDA